jgi:GNAT superfamily N-acetyltransferase
MIGSEVQRGCANGVWVNLFDGGQSDEAEVARFHLGIRRLQVASGENSFTDINDSGRDLCRIREVYLSGNGGFWWARDLETGAVVGCVGLRDERDGIGVVKRLAVDPEYRRRHVALSLMDLLMRAARIARFEALELHTGKKEKAKPLYEAFGFVVTGMVERNGDYAMRMDMAR